MALEFIDEIQGGEKVVYRKTYFCAFDLGKYAHKTVYVLARNAKRAKAVLAKHFPTIVKNTLVIDCVSA